MDFTLKNMMKGEKKMEIKKRALFSVGVVALILSLTTALYAASPEFDFYKGKVITYIVATKPGGGYDVYGRLIGKYMQKHIPGSTVIVKNVPGAGHIIGANETYLAKPNGLTIGTFNTGLIFSQIVGMEGIRFDLAKYSWIGKASSEHRVLIVSIKSPFKTIKDIIESPQLKARDFWVELDHPELQEKIKYPGVFIKMSETQPRMTRRAPLVGEHNSEIYVDELGITKKELTSLKRAKVI